MNATTFPIFEIIAILGIVLGPIIAYFAAKRKIGAEVLLIDISTIKGWSEVRKGFEAEISSLHKKLREERDKRRLEREMYLKQIAALEEELRVVLQLLEAAKIENDTKE